MSFCPNCGSQIVENSKFCANCGTPAPAPVVVELPIEEETVLLQPPVVEQPVMQQPVMQQAPVAVEEPVFVQPPVAEQPVFVQQPPVAPAPVSVNVSNDELLREEQEFLDNTYNLLRWEHKAWSITGKVLFILGIVFTAIFGFIAFIGLVVSIDSYEGVVMASMGFSYAFVFASYLVVGIIQKKTAEKMPLYIDTLYSDLSITEKRSGNIGMLIFTIFFGGVQTVFFIINFVRIKSSSNIINRILTRQGKI